MWRPGIGQVWYLIVSIPDICLLLSYFLVKTKLRNGMLLILIAAASDI